MAYIRPLVMVFQEYAKQSIPTQTTTLHPCIVGPCYHIIDPDKEEILALVGDYTESGMVGTLFPNNRPGALIVEKTPKFRFKNPIVRMSESNIGLASVEDNVLTFDAGTFPSYAQVGDTVNVIDTTNVDPQTVLQDGRVIGVNAAEYKILLNRKPAVGAGTSFEAEMLREVADFTLTTDGETLPEGISLDLTDESFDVLGITQNVNSQEKTVVYSELYVGYKALRQDLSDVSTVYNTDEAKGVLGDIDDPENPLGTGVMLALANTTVGVKCIGVDSDDVAGYTAAKDRLESYEDVYAIVPLTQEAEILAIFKQHVEQMSLPEVGMWRIAIGNTKLITDKNLQTGSGITKADGDGDLVVFEDDNAMFLSNQVDAGDVLKVTGVDGETVTYTVASVVSEDILTITPSTPFDPVNFASDGTAYAYDIFRNLDKTGQAGEIAEVSESFGSSRFVHVWPDVCTLDDQEVPGYYLCCAVAGAVGGLPPHQGLTRLSIGGLGGLRHSGDYFNQYQLDKIAGGGTFIFMQENREAAPFVRHQLTTDMSTIEFRELSFVKNFDYVSIICKDVMDKFLGKYNIVPSTLGVLETAIRAILESLQMYNLPRIGSPVLKYEVASVKQHDDIRDRVEIYANVWFPYALNIIGLHLVSQ